MAETEPTISAPEQPEKPLGQEAAAAILDMWAHTVGQPDIFGPGTKVEAPFTDEQEQ